MKQKLLLLCLAIFTAVGMQAQTYTEIDGLRYSLNETNHTAGVVNRSAPYPADNMYTEIGYEIPEQVIYGGEYYSVTSIENHAFSRCHNLAVVSIPSSVTTIGTRAFYQCENLDGVTFSRNITYIGQEAFRGTAITSVPLQNLTALDDVGKYAFYDCPLTSVDINIPRVINPIFQGSSNCSFTFYGNGVSKDYSNLIDEDLYANAKEIKLVGVERILDKAFLSMNIETLDLSESPNLYHIGAKAFSQTQFTNLPVFNASKWTYIGQSAFHQSNIETIDLSTLPANATIDKYVFLQCSSLKSVKLPNHLTNINEDMFDGCNHLETIELPSNLQTISKRAFWGCNSLSNISIPRTVTSIGTNAFYGCTALKVIEFGSFLGSAREAQNPNIGSTAVRLTIGNDVFEGCGNTIETVVWSLPSECVSWPTLRQDVNENCSHISDISYASVDLNGNKYFFSNNSGVALTYFFNKNASTEALVPSKVCDLNVLAIGDNSFSNDLNLQTVSFGQYVRNIGQSAFKGCTNLETVYNRSDANKAFCLSSTNPAINSIGAFAFQNCTNLKHLGLNSETNTIGNVSYIGQYAFMSTGLETIDLTSLSANASGTVIVDYSAFKKCPLKTVNMLSMKNGLIGREVFGLAEGAEMTIVGSNNDISTTKLEMAVDNLIDGFSKFKLSKVNLIGAFTEIGEKAFEYVRMEQVSLSNPDDLVTIGDNAFAFCYNLKGFSDGNTIKSLAQFKNLKSIGNGAFKKCESLTELEFPNSLLDFNYSEGRPNTTVGEEAFANTGLKKITREEYWPIGVSANTFDGINLNGFELMIQTIAVNEYKNATGWSYFFQNDNDPVVTFQIALDATTGEAYTRTTGLSAAVKFTTKLNKGKNAFFVPFQMYANDYEQYGKLYEIIAVHRYKMGINDDGSIKYGTALEFAEASTPYCYPHTPYIFIPNKEYEDKTVTFNLTETWLSGVPTDDQYSGRTAKDERSVWCASTKELFTLTGVYKYTRLRDENPIGTNYGISNGEFVKASETARVKPYRVYLNIKAEDHGYGADNYPIQAPERIQIFVQGEDDNILTEIKKVEADRVMGNGKMYDLQGREVKNPAQGIYFKNGKKVVIK